MVTLKIPLKLRLKTEAVRLPVRVLEYKQDLSGGHLGEEFPEIGAIWRCRLPTPKISLIELPAYVGR